MLNSVRVRLTLWYVLVFGLLLIGFSIFIYTLLAKSLYGRMDQSLSNAAQATAREFASEIDENQGDTVAGAAETLKELQLPGIYTAIFADDQLLATNYQESQQFTFPRHLLPATKSFGITTFHTIAGFGEDGARLAIMPQTIGGKDFSVMVIEPLQEITEQVEAIKQIFYIGLPGTLIIAGIGGFLLARKSLLPVVEMSEQAQRISASNLQERLTVSSPQDELGRLAEVFNRLLSRLDQSFEKMREFMADASHELRTPLSIIRGEAEVALTQDREASEYKETLAIIQDESKRLTRIVDDMMVLARADAGQQPLRLQDIYLNDLVEECCRAVQVLANGKNVTLTQNIAEDVTFLGDEDLLRRLIMNLLDNAIKYTLVGGTVFVKLVCNASEAKIIVEDTGIGIPSESIPQVFERFFRLDEARSRAEGGSGLGLAIAKWVAIAHKGSIDLTSKPGQGSKFVVTLPLKD
jgi:two-component system OmpR family sensor kinase